MVVRFRRPNAVCRSPRARVRIPVAVPPDLQGFTACRGYLSRATSTASTLTTVSARINQVSRFPPAWDHATREPERLIGTVDRRLLRERREGCSPRPTSTSTGPRQPVALRDLVTPVGKERERPPS